MAANERSDRLARAMEELGSGPMLAGCRCASPVAGLQRSATKVGSPGMAGAAAQVGSGIGTALFNRYREKQAHGLPGWFILGVGDDIVEIWTEGAGILPGELLWRWRRADVAASVRKRGIVFTHLIVEAPELPATQVRAATRGPKGYGTAVVDLLTASAIGGELGRR